MLWWCAICKFHHIAPDKISDAMAVWSRPTWPITNNAGGSAMNMDFIWGGAERLAWMHTARVPPSHFAGRVSYLYHPDSSVWSSMLGFCTSESDSINGHADGWNIIDKWIANTKDRYIRLLMKLTATSLSSLQAQARPKIQENGYEIGRAAILPHDIVFSPGCAQILSCSSDLRNGVCFDRTTSPPLAMAYPLQKCRSQKCPTLGSASKPVADTCPRHRSKDRTAKEARTPE